MKVVNQKRAWDNVAEEWFKFKNKPKKEVIDFLNKQKGRVLDLGCGSGRNLIKNKDIEFYLVDFSKEMVNFAKKNIKKQKVNVNTFICEADNLPFKDNFFNAVICISVLHCISGKKSRERVLREIYRVLKPGKKMFISVWNKDTKRFKNSPKQRYVRWRDKGKRYYYLYNESELIKLLEETGFKIIKVKSGANINIIVKK